MKKEFSLYLDAVRFICALLVVIYHVKPPGFDNSFMFSLGHEAVMFFFVLSGYIIAYTSLDKKRSLSDYFVSRVSRIYSVAIPAIILTYLFDFIGQGLSPETYSAGYMAMDSAILRGVSGTLFLNEIWFLSTQLFSNVPYWSLNYEVMFYVFGAFSIYTKGRLRIFFLITLSCCIGPKILLMLPIWYLGFLVYKWQNIRLSLLVGVFLFVFSVIGFSMYFAFEIRWVCSDFIESLVGKELFVNLTFSRYFLGDYFFAIFVLLNFVSVSIISRQISFNMPVIEKIISYLASITFTLYLLHVPLSLFFEAIIGEKDNWFNWIIIFILVISTVLLVSSFTERKKDFFKSVCRRFVDFFLLKVCKKGIPG